MGLWDEEIAPKRGGMTNAHLKFSVSYVPCYFNIMAITIFQYNDRFPLKNIRTESTGPQDIPLFEGQFANNVIVHYPF